jgi:hypothetical protein
VSSFAPLKEAVITAIYLKVNAEVQLQAMTIGTPRGLSVGEVERSLATQFSPLALDRAWEYFCARAGVDALQEVPECAFALCCRWSVWSRRR